ncbi:MAG: 30S ribosomal protein S27e [Candidatus Micrarchaeota archaeon]
MSKFLKVQCECGSESIVFGDAKSLVKCFNCKKVLLEPKGGRAAVNCKILEILG